MSSAPAPCPWEARFTAASGALTRPPSCSLVGHFGVQEDHMDLQEDHLDLQTVRVESHIMDPNLEDQGLITIPTDPMDLSLTQEELPPCEPLSE